MLGRWPRPRSTRTPSAGTECTPSSDSCALLSSPSRPGVVAHSGAAGGGGGGGPRRPAPPPPLRLPASPMPRLELPELERVAPGPPEARPLSVAGFVAAELRSIPARWIEEATARHHPGGAAVAIAAAPAPAIRPAVPARVRLVAA